MPSHIGGLVIIVSLEFECFSVVTYLIFGCSLAVLQLSLKHLLPFKLPALVTASHHSLHVRALSSLISRERWVFCWRYQFVPVSPVFHASTVAMTIMLMGGEGWGLWLCAELVVQGSERRTTGYFANSSLYHYGKLLMQLFKLILIW